MHYEHLVARLFEISLSRGMNLSLDNAQLLADLLDHPERAYSTVHVAGTNGKGSVTTKIGKVLELSGYKVGVYTSPHLFSFRERIAINGECISEEDVVAGLTRIFSVIDEKGITPTYFEILTFLAFDFFRKSEVDIAVVETGLGGRLDATNLIVPLVSIVTSISEDHMPLLGSTLEEVAQEKAGIIKPHVPLVIGPEADFQALQRQAALCHSPLYRVPKISEDYDVENSSIAKEALHLLKGEFTITNAALEKGLKMRPFCRFEEVEGVVFDVAHNLAGFKALFRMCALHFPHTPLRVIIGMSKDKEIKKCLKLLTQHCSHIHLVEAHTPRAAKTGELAHILKGLGYSSYTEESSIEKGVLNGKEKAADNGEKCIVCGTFFIMKEAKLALNAPYPVSDTLDLNERSVSQTSCILN